MQFLSFMLYGGFNVCQISFFFFFFFYLFSEIFSSTEHKQVFTKTKNKKKKSFSFQIFVSWFLVWFLFFCVATKIYKFLCYFCYKMMHVTVTIGFRLFFFTIWLLVVNGYPVVRLFLLMQCTKIAVKKGMSFCPLFILLLHGWFCYIFNRCPKNFFKFKLKEGTER